MRNTGHILAKLKENGFRFTQTRKALLDLLIKSPEPLSSPHIQRLLSRAKISVNKTTVYRELTFLKKQGLIRELQFGENIKKYEIMPENHHHHIVCVDCDKVENVEMNRDLDSKEKEIARDKNFVVLDHSLEFYGVCQNCQSNRK